MNQEDKEFPLDSKKNCCIYLNRIISSCELCMDKMKAYNTELKEYVDKYRGQDIVPYKIYSEMTDKSYNVISYLVNLLGDSQTVSISYFKYRNYISKHIKRGNTDIPFLKATSEISELLNQFNRERNWLNHIPESLLIEELKRVDNGKMEFPMNPVEIMHYNYVTFEYFNNLYLSNCEFYDRARRLIQFAKKEYSMLMGCSILYPRVYSNKPVNVDKSIAAIESAKKQGIKIE
ncbi:MAG: hypothetical protein IJ696_00040 [Ruminococcus sp.]|nr:hypothetical protein [Ruminococcus sp.]